MHSRKTKVKYIFWEDAIIVVLENIWDILKKVTYALGRKELLCLFINCRCFHVCQS